MGGMNEPHELSPGSAVEVMTRFEQRWSRGFEVADVVDGGYRVKRVSDGAVLPVVFTAASLRAETLAPALA
jgi:hypothetical protein